MKLLVANIADFETPHPAGEGAAARWCKWREGARESDVRGGKR